MKTFIRLLKLAFGWEEQVLPPPCRTTNRDPYSQQAAYIRRLDRQR